VDVMLDVVVVLAHVVVLAILGWPSRG